MVVRTAFRIEHPSDGKGPWTSRASHPLHGTDEFERVSERLPSPVHEEELRNLSIPRETRRFAFSNEELLLQYFSTPWLFRTLHTLGFRVRLYSVWQAATSSSQMIFDSSTAQLLREWTPAQFYLDSIRTSA